MAASNGHHSYLPRRYSESMRKHLLFTLLFCFVAVAGRSQTWTALSVPAKNFSSLEVFGNTMYAGTRDTLYVSMNKGSTWVKRKVPTSGYDVKAITFYSGRLFIGTGDGVFMSGDNGASWASSNIHVDVNDFEELNGYLYAVTNGGGIYICSQVSNTWSPSPLNPSTSISDNIYKVIRQENTMVAYSSSFGKSYRFNLNLQDWVLGVTPLFDGSRKLFDITYAGPKLTRLSDYGGYWQSEDNGATWYTDTTDMRVGTRGVLLSGYNNMYVFWNHPGGAWIQQRPQTAMPLDSWAPNEEWLTIGQVNVAREYNNRLYVATDYGIWSKLNGSPNVAVPAVTNEVQTEMFPNPATDGTAQIRAQGLSRVKITDALGRLVQDFSTSNDEAGIRLNLPGVYNVSMLVNGQWISRRLQVL